jgi:hypothetical protein
MKFRNRTIPFFFSLVVVAGCVDERHSANADEQPGTRAAQSDLGV